MQYPEFIEFINGYDFICLNETKTNDFDTVQIPGYTFKFQNRKSKSNVKSGGIAFGYRKYLESYVSQIDTNSVHVFWFKISGNYLKLDEDLLVGNIYIPPENSIYTVQEVFNELEQEYLNLCSTYKYIVIW